MSVLVAQWIARWTSNPEVPGSSPGEDDLFTLERTFCSDFTKLNRIIFTSSLQSYFIRILSLRTGFYRKSLTGNG